MNLMSLQTQRQLEVFLVRAGITEPNIDTSMQFIFPDHALYIEHQNARLKVTLAVDAVLDDEQMAVIYKNAFAGLTTPYLFRPFRIAGGVVLNVSLHDEANSEELYALYRMMLRLLAPWKKRSRK